MKYAVALVYRGQSNYIIEADSPEKAKEEAEKQFKDGEPGVNLGNEWEEIDHFGSIEEMP